MSKILDIVFVLISRPNQTAEAGPGSGFMSFRIRSSLAF